MNNQIKEDMKSILDNRPELVKEVNKVAEVAGYSGERRCHAHEPGIYRQWVYPEYYQR